MSYHQFKAPSTLMHYLKYRIERFLIKGPLYQILFIGLVIAIISFSAGYILLYIEPNEEGLKGSSWWAFLRMSDPGYLGDDNGTAKRVLATILTVLGYVLFMGSLVAIMTQWLVNKMRELEAGYTPISTRGHITILNYTNRTPIIIGQILASKFRLKRFLKSFRSRQAKVVILNGEVGHKLTTDLQEHIGPGRNARRVVFRTGDYMSGEDLARVNVEYSSVIILPSMVYGNNDQVDSDTRAIKSLLSIKNRCESQNLKPPRVVLELSDSQYAEVAKASYGEKLEVISGRVLLSRMIAQNIQNPSLSFVISELISQGEGSEIYLREFPKLTGRRWVEICNSFPNVIPIGIVSTSDKSRCVLNPSRSEILLADDLIVFIAEDFDFIELAESRIQEVSTTTNLGVIESNKVAAKKVLILGWSRKVPLLIQELIETRRFSFTIDLVSGVDIEKRKTILKRVLDEQFLPRIQHMEMDYTSAASYESLDVESYDNIVLVSSDRTQDGSDADARSILGLLQVRKIIGDKKAIPVLVELAEPENEKLFSKRLGETIISPMVISYILGNVALRPELNLVFDSLFNAGGADITFKNSADFELTGKRKFSEISEVLRSYSMIAIGMFDVSEKKIFLNPKEKDVFDLDHDFKVILIHS